MNVPECDWVNSLSRPHRRALHLSYTVYVSRNPDLENLISKEMKSRRTRTPRTPQPPPCYVMKVTIMIDKVKFER